MLRLGQFTVVPLFLFAASGQAAVVNCNPVHPVAPAFGQLVQDTQEITASIPASQWSESGSPYEFWSAEEHQVQVLEEGPAALEARLRLIESAKESIELETYFLNNDQSGRLLLQALRKKAKAGVKIRILLDHFNGKNSVNEYYANELRKDGIEVRYYNNARCIPHWIKCNHRDHRKLLIVDKKSAITGGRNIGDDYFGLNQSENKLDRDTLIRGVIVPKMRLTFEDYWNSPLSVRPPAVNEKSGSGRVKAGIRSAQSFFMDTPYADAALREKIKSLADAQLNASTVHALRNITFVSDKPGRGADSRVVRDHIHWLLSRGKDLTIENAYFILPRDERKLLKNRIKDGGKVALLTNGPKSPESKMLTISSYVRYSGLTRAGMLTYLVNGNAPADQELFDGTRETQWGTHAKTMVFDHKDTFIGSYNLDARSKWTNSECGIIVMDNPEFARGVESQIQNRTVGTKQLRSDLHLNDGTHAADTLTRTEWIQQVLVSPFRRGVVEPFL